MNKKVTIILIVAGLVVLAIFYSTLTLTNRRSNLYTKGSALIHTLSNLIEVADSVRNAVPDSALADYNKAIALIQNSGNDKVHMHLLARSYIGIAHIYSAAGEYKLALKNDSIAMQIANQFDDKQMQAKAYVIRGMTLYKFGEYEKALKSYEKAEKLAIEKNDFEILAKIAANRAMFYSRQGNYQKAIEGFTQALNIGKQLNNEPLIAGNYMNLAVVYYNMSKNDSVMVYYNRALLLFQKLNDKNGVIKCYNNIGNVYYDCSDYAKAIGYYQLTVKLALEMDDKSNTAKGYHNLAEVYIHLGDDATAADYLFKSIKIKEQLNDKLSLVKGYFGLGEMYYKRKDYPKSLTYFKKSLKLSQEINYSTQIGSSYSGIASVYSDENKLDSAILYYNKAMELYKQIDYPYGISNLYINLGDVYRVNKNYVRSEKLLLQALHSKTALNEEEETAIVNNSLANLYLTKFNRQDGDSTNNLLKKAEKFGFESYKTAQRLGALPVMRDASITLKNIYQKQSKYSDALKYSEISSSLNDSLLNKDKIQALTFAEARWNIDKKQQEIDNLENTQKLSLEIIQQKETETRQQKLIIWFIIVLFVLTSVTAVIVSLYLRKRRETVFQKQLVKMTALRMQNARNTMSPHFFFNVLASLSGLSHQPELLKKKLKSLSLLLRKVIENIDQTAISLDQELEAVKAYIDLNTSKIPEPFTVEYLIAEGTKLHGLIPAMMIQIPVENAIKHGLMPLDGDKILTISVADYDDHQHITITDNGIGLKASAGRSTGTGTGLKVLLQTIHLLNANNRHKINFSVDDRESDSAVSSGTTVNIKIPVNFNYIL